MGPIYYSLHLISFLSSLRQENQISRNDYAMVCIERYICVLNFMFLLCLLVLCAFVGILASLKYNIFAVGLKKMLVVREVGVSCGREIMHIREKLGEESPHTLS